MLASLSPGNGLDAFAASPQAIGQFALALLSANLDKSLFALAVLIFFSLCIFLFNFIPDCEILIYCPFLGSMLGL